MSVKVVIRRTYRGVPIEVQAELNDTTQIELLSPIMERLGWLVNQWVLIKAKKHRRVIRKHRKWRGYDQLDAMSHAKTFLFRKSP